MMSPHLSYVVPMQTPSHQSGTSSFNPFQPHFPIPVIRLTNCCGSRSSEVSLTTLPSLMSPASIVCDSVSGCTVTESAFTVMADASIISSLTPEVNPSSIPCDTNSDSQFQFDFPLLANDVIINDDHCKVSSSVLESVEADVTVQSKPLSRSKRRRINKALRQHTKSAHGLINLSASVQPVNSTPLSKLQGQRRKRGNSLSHMLPSVQQALKVGSCTVTGNSEAKKFTCSKRHKMCDTLQNCSMSSAVVCSDADKGIFSVDEAVVACDVNDESQYIVIEDSDTAKEWIPEILFDTEDELYNVEPAIETGTKDLPADSMSDDIVTNSGTIAAAENDESQYIVIEDSDTAKECIPGILLDTKDELYNLEPTIETGTKDLSTHSMNDDAFTNSNTEAAAKNDESQYIVIEDSDTAKECIHDTCSDAVKGIFSGTDQSSSKTSVESCLTELIAAASDYVDEALVACDMNDESQYIVIEDSDTAKECIPGILLDTKDELYNLEPTIETGTKDLPTDSMNDDAFTNSNTEAAAKNDESQYIVIEDSDTAKECIHDTKSPVTDTCHVVISTVKNDEAVVKPVPTDEELTIVDDIDIPSENIFYLH